MAILLRRFLLAFALAIGLASVGVMAAGPTGFLGAGPIAVAHADDDGGDDRDDDGRGDDDRGDDSRQPRGDVDTGAGGTAGDDSGGGFPLLPAALSGGVLLSGAALLVGGRTADQPR